jgi:hypothetical protein
MYSRLPLIMFSIMRCLLCSDMVLLVQIPFLISTMCYLDMFAFVDVRRYGHVLFSD